MGSGQQRGAGFRRQGAARPDTSTLRTEAPAPGTKEINRCHCSGPYCLPGLVRPRSVAYFLGSSPRPII